MERSQLGLLLISHQHYQLANLIQMDLIISQAVAVAVRLLQEGKPVREVTEQVAELPGETVLTAGITLVAEVVVAAALVQRVVQMESAVVVEAAL
jgi:hypothetical protein